MVKLFSRNNIGKEQSKEDELVKIVSDILLKNEDDYIGSGAGVMYHPSDDINMKEYNAHQLNEIAKICKEINTTLRKNLDLRALINQAFLKGPKSVSGVAESVPGGPKTEFTILLGEFAPRIEALCSAYAITLDISNRLPPDTGPSNSNPTTRSGGKPNGSFAELIEEKQKDTKETKSIFENDFNLAKNSLLNLKRIDSNNMPSDGIIALYKFFNNQIAENYEHKDFFMKNLGINKNGMNLLDDIIKAKDGSDIKKQLIDNFDKMPRDPVRKNTNKP